MIGSALNAIVSLLMPFSITDATKPDCIYWSLIIFIAPVASLQPPHPLQSHYYVNKFTLDNSLDK
jgi:hypothetical protein